MDDSTRRRETFGCAAPSRRVVAAVMAAAVVAAPVAVQEHSVLITSLVFLIGYGGAYYPLSAIDAGRSG